MASNYPSDPNNAASLNKPPSGPQSGSEGAAANYAVPMSAQASSTPSGGANGDSHRRLASGTELSWGRYKIERMVAAGGMGAVYRAVDTRLEDPCAVKEMLDDYQSETERTQALGWFKREMKLLSTLNHPCIPHVRDFFVENGKHYIVMDFVQGRTLAEVLEKEGNVVGINGARGISEARARSWGRQVSSVLNYLHRLDPPIIFRDLKPSNIMVTERDEIKLIDFGIARAFQSQRQSTVIMTVGYAPPEQMMGSAEPRSDIYALGATLHRVLTRHDAANNKPNLYVFPPIRTLRPDISVNFEQIIMRALAVNLEQRWPNAGEMERAIINLPPITVVPPVGPTIAVGPAIAQSQPRPLNPQTPNIGGTPNTPANPTFTTTGPGGTYITAALGYMNANRVEEAYASVQQAYTLEPNNAIVHRLFGQVFARRRPPSPEQATRAYNRSLQLNPNDAETHKLLADVSLFLVRQPAQAIQGYTQALRLNPGDAEAHQRLAQCYEETSQLEPALREYHEAARLAPKNALIQQKIGQIALRLNQLTVAERAFVQALTLNPADNPTRFLLAQVYENEGKFTDAERECAYVAPYIPAAQAMLLRIRSRLGR